jgi:hypothetical protein
MLYFRFWLVSVIFDVMLFAKDRLSKNQTGYCIEYVKRIIPLTIFLKCANLLRFPVTVDLVLTPLIKLYLHCRWLHKMLIFSEYN